MCTRLYTQDTKCVHMSEQRMAANIWGDHSRVSNIEDQPFAGNATCSV